MGFNVGPAPTATTLKLQAELVAMLSQPKNVGRAIFTEAPVVKPRNCDGCGAPLNGPTCDYCKSKA